MKRGRPFDPGPYNPRSGARLPIADPAPPKATPCDRNQRHRGGIRFELHRYGRKVGEIRLCGDCYTALNPAPRPDPLQIEPAA